MPSPTVSDFFGTSAEVITANASVNASAASPALIIRFSDFSGQGWDSLAGGDEADPEKWITAIARKIYDFTTANADDVSNVVITAPILGLESRNGALKRRFSYGLDIYQPDAGSVAPSPNLI